MILNHKFTKYVQRECHCTFSFEARPNYSNSIKKQMTYWHCKRQISETAISVTVMLAK